MGTYLARRLVLAVPTVLGVVTAVFLLIRLVPGDVVTQMIGLEGSLPTGRVEELNRMFGIDRPLHVQYAEYVGNVTRGNLGRSLRTGRPVGAELARRFPVTIELSLLGLLVAISIGIPIGIPTRSCSTARAAVLLRDSRSPGPPPLTALRGRSGCAATSSSTMAAP